MDDITRDARTIFVQQLVSRVTEGWVRSFFEQVGPVARVKLIRDPHTRKCMGMGYIEFQDLDAVPKALLLNGQKMSMDERGSTSSGLPIQVSTCGAERAYAHEAEDEIEEVAKLRTLYLGNLPPGLEEGDVKAIAEKMGPVVSVILKEAPEVGSDEEDEDEGGSGGGSGNKPEGYAIVKFGNEQGATNGLHGLAGVDIAGQVLHLGLVSVKGEVHGANNEIWRPGDRNARRLSASAKAQIVANLRSAAQSTLQQMGGDGAAALIAAAQAEVAAGGAPGSANGAD